MSWQLNSITTARLDIQAREAAETATVAAPALIALEQIDWNKLLSAWQRATLRRQSCYYRELLSSLSSPTDPYEKRSVLTRRGHWLRWLLPTHVFKRRNSQMKQGSTWNLVLPGKGPVDEAYLTHYWQHVINPAAATHQQLAEELQQQSRRLLHPVGPLRGLLKFCREFPRWNPMHLRGREGQPPESTIGDAFTEREIFVRLLAEFNHRESIVKATPPAFDKPQTKRSALAEPFAPLLLNYSLSELAALLTELGLVDKATGRATPAASPGAWVGVFHGLIEAEPPRMVDNKAAAHREFTEVFGAKVSESLLYKGLGKTGSQAEKTRFRVIEALKR